jgi:small subunit ribosomal protein S19
MTRSVWKGPFVDPSLLRSTHIKRKVWSRRSCILPQFVGCYTQIYNGTKWIGLKITEEMVGHKFGEFASTRKKRLIHVAERLRGGQNKLKQKAR